ncbi:MAG: SEC-C domain-containing protein [Betaproteobacteria bacterium]|nr:SEC-C domain-containing protein [Betaproteobacteria bacterium]
MLDPREGTAAWLARGGDSLPIPIRESAAELAIEWHADYRIEGRAFTVVERDSGSVRTILGYPVADIERLSCELAADGASDSRLSAARERLKSRRNEPCPCGSGRKYKRCCLRSDEGLVRQMTAAPQAEAIEHVEPVAPPAGAAIGEDPGGRYESGLPRKLSSRLDALWKAVNVVNQPTAAQMDELLGELLALPPEATWWNEVLSEFARRNHPHLHAVFRRIAAAVPHTKKTGMASFYWAAAEEFAGKKLSALLPELVDGFCKLDRHSYDADALAHIEDYLLAGHFEAEALRLAEHFLPIEREDSGLMSYAVPGTCNLIFQLRVGIALRSGGHAAASPQELAPALARDIEEEIHAEAIAHAARVICEPDSRSPWTRAHFALVTGDIRTSDRAWQECLHLYGALMGVARDAWRCESFPPGCAFLGLSRLLESVYNARAEAGKKRKRKPERDNLLDYLNPDGMEARLARSCRDLLGVNEPCARILLDAEEVLLRFAIRHQLTADAGAAATRAELARLRGVLEGGR